MQRCGFTPYEGKKPYIFISYAHKDSHLVFPILEELDRRGYRVWYDDGIAPGSEWPENIAQHLDACSVTMAFISPNSIASANCRREVTFALSKRKPFLGIVLQPTEMSLGMEMQLSAQQCIMKYTYSSEEDFLRKVCSCPDLQPCLGQPKAAPIAEPAAPVVPKEAPAPKPRPEKKPANKKLVGILAAAAAAVVVLAVVLIIALGGEGTDDPGRDPQNPQGSSTASKPQGNEPSQTEPNATVPVGDTDKKYLRYKDQVITAEDVACISRQTALQELEMQNCVIQADAMQELALPATLTKLILENCEGITSLRGLEHAEELKLLRIVNCDLQDGILPALTSKVLKEVDLSGNPAFTELEKIAQCTAVEKLNFSGTAVASVAAVTAMEKLTHISGNATQVKDLSAVTNLTGLLEVSFADCGIESIETPFYSLYMEVLDLSGNLLTNTDALTYCTTLRVVDLSYNDISYPEKLQKSGKYLKELNLSGNPHLYDFYLDFLLDCTVLEKLSLDGMALGDLEELATLTKLKYLSLVDCSVRSLDNLGQMTQLEYLNLSFNRFSDISPLQGILGTHVVLDLSFNDNLTDISALPSTHYYVLNLTGSPIDYYTAPVLSGTLLLTGYDDAWHDPQCMKEGEGNKFTYVAMVDCPLDQVVAMRERFGQFRMLLLNDVEAYLLKLEEMEIDTEYLHKNLKQ